MLTVADLMTQDVFTANPTTKLREVAAIMNRHGCRQVPVVVDERLIGIISNRDIRLMVDCPILNEDLAKRRSLLDSLRASNCMTTDVVTVHPWTPLIRGVELLNLYKFNALPVVDEMQRLVGILTVTAFCGSCRSVTPMARHGKCIILRASKQRLRCGRICLV